MKPINTILLLAAMVALPLLSQDKALPTEAKAKVTASCFEVVVPRPDPDKDPVTYEKDLPWELVPFNLRNDKYISIGTAFAVSDHELVTAHHVLEAVHASMGYSTCFIRDADQRVFEVDQILALDEQRDVVRFTAKNLKFKQWLRFENGFKTNQSVFTVGNAYGEGVVVRPGEIIGTIPEPLMGAWNLMKSSADVSPGNSGGPLVDTEGRVVGVVLAKKDNICYSLPSSQVEAMKAAAVFFNKVTYSFSLVPEKSKAIDKAFEIPLPLPYTELRKEICARNAAHYTKSMDSLFASLGGDLFPSGESSEEAISDIPTSGNPEVVYRDKTTKKWAFSGLEYKSADLGKNGRLSYASAAGSYFFNIRKPDNVALGDLLAKPRLAMDLLLKGVPVSRTVGGQEIRITSFGDPYEVKSHIDRFGRPWQEATWFTAYDDGIVYTFSALTPSGIVMAAKFINSSQLMEWRYDLPKVLDYTYLPYSGRLRDWSEFLKHRDSLPQAFRDITFDYKPGQSLKFQALWASLDLNAKEADLSPRAFLSLHMGFSRRGSGVVWDLRRIGMDDDEEDNYFVLLKHLHPTPTMEDGPQNAWKEVAKERHPYTRKAFQEEGSTRIAALLRTFVKPGASLLESGELFTLFLSRSGKIEEAEMQERLGLMMPSVSLVSAPTAWAGTQPLPASGGTR